MMERERRRVMGLIDIMVFLWCFLAVCLLLYPRVNVFRVRRLFAVCPAEEESLRFPTKDHLR